MVGPIAAEPETTPGATAFDITVRAPEEVRELVEKHIELQRYRAVTDLDDNELARLLVLADRNVRELLGTLGYFEPDVSITQETPVGRKTIVVNITPGVATKATAVAIDFSGDIATTTDSDAKSQQDDIRRSWQLPAGQPFTQNAWDSAKNQALRSLTVRRYPAGKLADSLADIDAPNATAALSMRLDSGPLYRLGQLKVTGVERYDPVLVPRLARLNAGDVYDQKALTDAQQRLAASGYFDSAYVFLDPDGDPAAAPVEVQVREAQLQKVILGVGLTTDSGPRASVEHTHNRLPGIGWRAVTKIQAEQKSPFAQTEWTSIPDIRNWRLVALARAERLNDDDLTTQATKLRFGRTQQGDTIDRAMYLQYDRAQVRGAGTQTNAAAQAGDGSALTANYIWTGRYFDGLPFPSKGYGLGFELGGGTTLATSATVERQPFARLVGRWLGIQPLSRGRIAMRAEAGAVLSKTAEGIPGTQLFRTGGDTSVRGYSFREIGITLPNGVTGPGRYLAVGSVEWQRPLIRNGLPSEFENTFFIDAGAVGDTAKDLRPAVGIGTGLRWRSPIGPLQMDLAYGVKVRQVRLHVSVGFVF
jgi:translocation and assembly module TamA